MPHFIEDFLKELHLLQHAVWCVWSFGEPYQLPPTYIRTISGKMHTLVFLQYVFTEAISRCM